MQAHASVCGGLRPGPRLDGVNAAAGPAGEGRFWSAAGEPPPHQLAPGRSPAYADVTSGVLACALTSLPGAGVRVDVTSGALPRACPPPHPRRPAPREPGPSPSRHRALPLPAESRKPGEGWACAALGDVPSGGDVGKKRRPAGSSRGARIASRRPGSAHHAPGNGGRRRTRGLPALASRHPGAPSWEAGGAGRGEGGRGLRCLPEVKASACVHVPPIGAAEWPDAGLRPAAAIRAAAR